MEDCVRENALLFCLLPVLLLLVFPYPSTALPLCTDLRAPVKLKKPLAFCPSYNGSVCCDSSRDSQLRQRFDAMNISDAACASSVKSILCSNCDQFSAELFDVKSGPRSIPVLCNSSSSNGGGESRRQELGDFCATVWDVCQNVPILGSPFAPSLQSKTGVPQASNASKLTDLWKSKTEFCAAFSEGDDAYVCFSGEQVSLQKDEDLIPPKGMCLEKIGKGSYLNMAPHPDGSNRAFFSDQPGKIWLATIPEQDSGNELEIDESSPFVDLTDEVNFDTVYGLMGIAFHPNFAKNGRFFASYNCDKAKSPGCTGRCACNSDVDCDPSKLVSPDAAPPCKDYVVVAEFSANGSSSKGEKGSPFEVRRIFTMGLPFGGNHGGQILFGPEDGYLYLMMGDGGGKGDPYNFAQNKKSLLGKILRLDIDNIPSEAEIEDGNLWGNYSIPADNPFSEDKDMAPEVWALGLRNPWRCSFDSERHSYFICGDVGQDQYEEVDIVTKGGNYGWRLFEGPETFQNDPKSPGGNTSLDTIDPIFPIVGYNHSDVNKKEGSAAISGGFIFRSQTDPCLYGSYLYGDLYAKNLWAAAENPKNSGSFTQTDLPFSCAADSPIACSSVPNSPLPALNIIYSFGQDNRKDFFVLTMGGVYRVVRPSRCNYTCSKEDLSAAGSHPPPPPPPQGSFSGRHSPDSLLKQLVVFSFSFLVVFSRF